MKKKVNWFSEDFSYERSISNVFIRVLIGLRIISNNSIIIHFKTSDFLTFLKNLPNSIFCKRITRPVLPLFNHPKSKCFCCFERGYFPFQKIRILKQSPLFLIIVNLQNIIQKQNHFTSLNSCPPFSPIPQGHFKKIKYP